MKIKIYLTSRIADKANKDDNFKNFVLDSINRHLSGDWGETCAEDAEINNTNPLDALSTYIDTNKNKIWIKQDYNILTVLFPSEY